MTPFAGSAWAAVRGARIPAAGGFNAPRRLRWLMRCHYCDSSAAFTAEKEGVRVGLCKAHFQERFNELADSETFDELREELDIDRA